MEYSDEEQIGMNDMLDCYDDTSAQKMTDTEDDEMNEGHMDKRQGNDLNEEEADTNETNTDERQSNETDEEEGSDIDGNTSDSEDKDFDKIAKGMKLTWNKEYKKVKINEFSESTGPTTTLPQNVLQIFQYFFTNHLITMIAEQSNLYARASMGEEAYQKWEIITTEEIKAYLGFFILMGLVRLPSIYDYWSTNLTYHYSRIADHISRDHFTEIHKYLHFLITPCFLHMVHLVITSWGKYNQ